MALPSLWIEMLDLMPHPEGGFYSEVYRSSHTFEPPAPYDGPRSAATCIYYLLPNGAFSAFHRLLSDEIWSHLAGGSVTIHVINGSGRYICERLGSDPHTDARPLVHIKPNCWFAAEPAPHMDSLVSCVVTPGFDFADFELAKRDHLKSLCPSQTDLIERLTRE